MGSEKGNNRQTVNSGGFEAEFKELVSIGRHIHSIEITRCSFGTLLASEGWNSDERVSWQDPTSGGFVHLLPSSLTTNRMGIAMEEFDTGVRYLDRRTGAPALGHRARLEMVMVRWIPPENPSCLLRYLME